MNYTGARNFIYNTLIVADKCGLIGPMAFTVSAGRAYWMSSFDFFMYGGSVQAIPNSIDIRDWLFVEDHARAIDVIFHKAKLVSTYNIGGHNEWTNIDVIKLLCDMMDEKLGREKGTNRKLITYVTDRAGHDLRYAIDSSKLQNDLGWKPSLQFEEGLSKTVDWYLQNEEWLTNVTTGAYANYYEKQYTQ